MDMTQIVLFGLTCTLLYLILKETQPTIAFILVFITSVFIFIFIIEQIKVVVSFIETLAARASIEMYYLNTVIKIIGIAYIVEISANMMKDAGLSSIASKVELAGKIFILLLALPIIQAVIEMIIQFIPTGMN